MDILWLSLASSASWFASTITGCGSPVLLIPLVGFYLGLQAVAPTLTIGMLLGNSQRIALYWQEIDRPIVAWFLPGAAVGASLGAFAISKLQTEWVALLLGVVLFLSALDLFGQSSSTNHRIQRWHFLPAGMAYSFLSGLVGSAGPLLNAMYLGYGLSKEEMIATKAANQVFMHATKVLFYCLFGVMSLKYLLYGLAIGLAALPGNWLGQKVLVNMKESSFRKLAFTFIALSGISLVWEQRGLLLALAF